MPFFFNEGLPGAGKTADAVMHYILPAIKSGRKVFAHINGLNHQAIADYLKLDVYRVQALLIPMSRDDLRRLPDVVEDNSLVVIDEIQNYWGKHTKLTEAETVFVTEHRHRGLDIVAMGQSLKDVNVIWRRRVQIKNVYVNLEAVGRPQSYSVTIYQHKGEDEYEKVKTEVHNYDPAVFGMYKSVKADTVNATRNTDSRANVFNSQLFRWTIPVMLAFGIWGGYSIYGFFKGDSLAVQVPDKDQTQQGPQQAPQQAATPPAPDPAAPIPKPAMTEFVKANTPPPIADTQRQLLDQLNEQGRIRLGALMHMRGRSQGLIEWVDTGGKVVHRMDFAQLRELGVNVQPGQTTVTLTHGKWQAIATPWPTIEPDGAMSRAQVLEVNNSQSPKAQQIAPVKL